MRVNWYEPRQEMRDRGQLRGRGGRGKEGGREGEGRTACAAREDRQADDDAYGRRDRERSREGRLECPTDELRQDACNCDSKAC